MSSSLIGALIGTLAAGSIADALGRKTTLVIAGYIFFGCGALLGWSPSITVLVAGRALLGLAIGLQSTVLPLYIAECAPALIRGSLNTMPQVRVTKLNPYWKLTKWTSWFGLDFALRPLWEWPATWSSGVVFFAAQWCFGILPTALFGKLETEAIAICKSSVREPGVNQLCVRSLTIPMTKRLSE